MACFTAPLVAAIAAGAARRVAKKNDDGNRETIGWAAKLGWLGKLSFGGCEDRKSVV